MSDQRNQLSDHVRYVLQKEEQSTLPLEKEPDGWVDDDLEIIRNKKYHGIFTQITNSLKFIGHAKDYIKDAYAIGGLNTNLYLIKYVLRKQTGYKDALSLSANEVKWVQQYRGLADYTTMSEKDNAIELNFNSDELEQLLKSHETDDFEIERTRDIDNKSINKIGQNITVIEGRELSGIGRHHNRYPFETGSQPFDINFNKLVIPTEFGVKGFDRHVEANDALFDQSSSLGWQSSFFYDDIEGVNLQTTVTVDIDFALRINIEADVGFAPKIVPFLVIYKFELVGGSGSYTETFRVPLGDTLWENNQLITYKGLNALFAENTWAYTIEFEVTNFSSNQNGGLFVFRYDIERYDVEVTEFTKFDSRGDTYKFSFVNEVASRLMEIMTGKKNKFYSKLFGRNLSNFPPTIPSGSDENQIGEVSLPQYQDYEYAEDGEQGNVALIHGFNIRKFSQGNELYKSLTISVKSLIESLQSVFNIGVGIEPSKFGQRLRFEKLEHFYRDAVVVKLPNQVTNVSRTVEKGMFFSAASFGSDRGGDYENGLGLDEPNIKTTYISPLRKTEGKYTRTTQIRSDDTGMELLRRQPEYLDETADRSGDDHYWFLDLIVTPEFIYNQLHWSDVLAEEPSGILSPDTYRSWKFTPKRSLINNGWVLRAGMEQAIHINNSVFTLGSSNSNVNLETRYLNETQSVKESDIQRVGDLERSILLPETITFRHPIDDELMDWILGTTKVEIGGEIEDVPNWYFKVEWFNENEERETGYIMSIKPQSDQFEMIRANENIIFGGIK